MGEKSLRRIRLEESLKELPGDAFLRYGLAVQCVRDGDIAEGRARLIALIADHPDDQIAAYQQLGQSYFETGEPDDARRWLTAGIAKAVACRDEHAAAEMQGLLEQLG